MKTIAIAVALLALGACAPPGPVVHEAHPVIWDTPASADRAPRPRRHSRAPAMLAGGIAGALIGGLLGADACDDLNETDEECDDRTAEGALAGGGIGVLAGAILGGP